MTPRRRTPELHVLDWVSPTDGSVTAVTPRDTPLVVAPGRQINIAGTVYTTGDTLPPAPPRVERSWLGATVGGGDGAEPDDPLTRPRAKRHRR